MRAWLASLVGLATALTVAVAVYSMPLGDAVNSAHASPCDACRGKLHLTA